MEIVIVGGGTVGAEICTQLAGDRHSITVIDRSETALSEIANISDVVGIVGNGISVSVLQKAGVGRADLLIAVTSDDEINILCCAAAKQLGVKHTVARVRNPEYTELMQLMASEIHLSLTINPEQAVAEEIARVLRFPTATKVDTLCRGKVELAQFSVQTGSPLCGRPLNELRGVLNVKFLICAVLRGGDAYIPSGDFILEAGDTVCVTAPDEEITGFFKAAGAYRQPVKNVLIAGGDRTTYYLEESLRKNGIRSTVIEKDEARCAALAESFHCTVVCDRPTKRERLHEEGLERADAFLALSGDDEDNVITSLYAKAQGVPKVVTMVKHESYLDIFKSAGLDTIVSPKSSTVTNIVRYLRSMARARDAEIESLHRFMDDKVEALEFAVKEEIEGITCVPLRELSCRAGVLIACIVHRGETVIPNGNDMIMPGDTVIVVTAGGKLNRMKDIVAS